MYTGLTMDLYIQVHGSKALVVTMGDPLLHTRNDTADEVGVVQGTQLRHPHVVRCVQGREEV